MTTKSILRNTEFEEIAEVKPDAKHRVILGKVAKRARFYRVYQNAFGQIILDPQSTVPAYEAWLFQNKDAAAMVRRGLQDARRHRVVKAREDYSKYLDA